MTRSQRHRAGLRFGKSNVARHAGQTPATRCGLTLLEVILAISLIVLSMGAIFGFYRYVCQTRADVLADVEKVSQTRGAMEQITAELRAGAVGDRFDMESIRFTTLKVPGIASWALRDDRAEAPVPQKDAVIVEYRLRPTLDEDGRPILGEDGTPQIDGLERLVRTVSRTVEEEGQDVEVTLVTPHVKFFMLRYWNPEAAEPWGTTFQGSMPLAVEVTLGPKPLPAGTDVIDYPYEISRRIIYVPNGLRSALGNVNLGPSGAGGVR